MLPDGRIEKLEKGEKGNIFSPYMIIQYILSFIMSLCYGTYGLNISFAVVENGMNTAFVSVLSSCVQATQLAMCFLLVYYIRFTKGHALMVSCGLFIIAKWLLVFAQSGPAFIATCLLFGMSFNVYWVIGIIDIPKHVSKNSITKAISLWSAVSFGSVFVNPYIITKGAALLLDGSVHSRFLLSSIIASVVIGICIVCYIFIIKKEN